MTKLRVASHRLEIEVGRWARPNKLPKDERNVGFAINLKISSIFYLNIFYIVI